MSALVEGSFHCVVLRGAELVSVRGSEAMNELPRFTVTLVHHDADVDLAGLLRAPATLGLRGRAIPLIVCKARYAGAAREGHLYELSLGSFVEPLCHGQGYRIFQKKTSHEILAETLASAGIAGAAVQWRLLGRYVERVQCVHYAESPWAFVGRVAGDDGINVWIDADDDGAARVVFGDAPSSHEGIAGPLEVPFVEPSALIAKSESFFALARVEELAVESVQILDYDPLHPDVLVDGRAGDGPLEHFEYPARVLAGDAARARAQTRLEQLRANAQRLEGSSTCARLQPGRIVRVAGARDARFDGDYLVVSVQHRLAQATRDAASASTYENQVVLVPASTPYRPPIPGHIPRVAGVETATVTGPRGDEIHVDAHGSVTLAHRWDPSGIADERASRWVRTLQWNLGGAMMLPRVGFEVAVAYVDGSPDEPVVLGQVWNGAHRPPYPLPAHKAVSCIKSATSPGGGSSHEIRFGDGAGGQEAFLNATNTQAVVVGGSQTNSVAANQLHAVATSLTIGAATQTITVGGSQEVSVGTDEMITAGARTLSVGGSETLSTKQSAYVKTGSYSELIGALYMLRCNSSFTTVKGNHTHLVGGPITLAAGLGTHHSTAAARVELVAGPRNVLASGDCIDAVTGVQTTNAGSCTENTQKTVTECKTFGLTAATLDVKAGAFAVLAGSTVSIKAASLAVSGGSSLKVSGSIQGSGGPSKIDASSTTMKSGEKAGS